MIIKYHSFAESSTHPPGNPGILSSSAAVLYLNSVATEIACRNFHSLQYFWHVRFVARGFLPWTNWLVDICSRFCMASVFKRPKGLSAFVWRLWKSLICGWWENGQGYHLAICRDNSLYLTIVHGEAINKIQIKYLRQLAFELDKEPQHNPLST